MEETNFINKTQFTVLYEHFKVFLDNLMVDDNNEKFISEFGYLLEQFRNAFNDSERKTSKICQLGAEKNNIENDIKSKIQEKNSTVAKLEEKVTNLDKEIEYYCDERNKSVHEIEKLKHEILNYVTSEATLTPGVETQPQMVSGHNRKSDEDLLPEKRTSRSESSTPYFNYISKRNLNYMREKDSKLLFKKIKVLETEVKLRRKDIFGLKKDLEKEELALEECCFALIDLNHQKVKLERTLNESRESYEFKLYTFSEKMNAIKSKQRNIKERIKYLKEQRNNLMLQLQKREKDLEEACTNLIFLMEKETRAKKQAKMFEAQLASNRKNWANMMPEMKKSREVKQKFKKDDSWGVITKQKSVPLQEKMSTSDVKERQRLAEHLQSQLTLRDKEIAKLKEEIVEKNHELASLKEELAKKCKTNTILSEELSQSKKAVLTLTETVQNLRSSLQELEKNSARLQGEIKSQRLQCCAHLEELNKLRKMFEKLTAVKAQRELERRVLIKSQHTLINTLKIKDDQVNKLCITRHQRWIRQ